MFGGAAAEGRYVLGAPFAAGSTATVHYGRLRGVGGFARTVAIKRLHPQLAKDREFVAMLIDEARLMARIRHPNVVSVHDVVSTPEEIALVMDYVDGEPLSRLLPAAAATGRAPPPEVAVGIVMAVLHGLDAAHRATSETGVPLGIIHRDVTPHNVLVGSDGVARLADFGVARARGRLQATCEGQVKGKLAYMAPEHLLGERIDARADVYSAAVLLWEALTLRRLFQADADEELVRRVLNAPVDRPSRVVSGIPCQLDDVVMKGLARDPAERWPSAGEMARALERTLAPASPSRVGRWVDDLAAEPLAARRAALLDAEEQDASTLPRAGASISRARIIAAACCAALGASVALVASPSDSPRPAALRATLEVAPPAPEASPTTTAEGSAGPSAVAAAPVPAASAPLGGPPQVVPARGKPRVLRPATSGRAASKPGCDPPYSVDARGIVQLKKECL